MKRTIALFLSLLLVFSVMTTGVFAEAPVAQLSTQNITIAGEKVEVEAYNVDGNNYFKLRDLAILLSGTESEFDVSYDEAARTVCAKTGEGYALAAGEIVVGEDKSDTIVASSQKIVVDNLTVDVDVYNIGGNNYFKLRDLALALGFEVKYDEATRTAEITPKDTDSIALRLADAIDLGAYAWEKSEDGSYYALMGVVYCADPAVDAVYTDKKTGATGIYETMNIYVPAAYFEGGEINGYNAENAPVIFQNNCSGWKSSTPGGVDASFIEEGYVFVNCGARSRGAGTDSETDEDLGKAPIGAVDLKAGLRFLRYNADVLYGDLDKVVSIGTSGGGQMSSIFGASGDMEEYYPYLYEIGAAGIDYVDGKYVTTLSDAVFAAQCYCPIADIANADLAYAWSRFDSSANGKYEFSEFKQALEKDLAIAFAEYVNTLGLTNEEGEELTFDVVDGKVDPRSGSYYDQVLQNMSDALNLFVENTEWPLSITKGKGDSATTTVYEDFNALLATYTNTEDWLKKNADGTYSVTDMAGFFEGTALNRNKDIPGFDTFGETAENDAFGDVDVKAAHYSASVAKVLQDNYDRYSKLEGFADCDVDDYIADALTGEDAELIADQVYLMNATQLMLDGVSTPAQYWRTRNGTADQHTSFTVAYNLAMAAFSNDVVKDVDYSLVWNMGHGSNEGETTGTFIDWVNDLCRKDYETEISFTINGVESDPYKWEYHPAAIDDPSTYGIDETAPAYYKLTNVEYIQDAPTYVYGKDKAVVQCMNIYVPAEYIENPDAVINGYTIDTAPIIYKNANSGWRTGLPLDGFQFMWQGNYEVNDGVLLEDGCVYIGVGSRGRNTAKSPAQIIDLKSGVRFLRENDAIIPGSTDRIVSIADSGGGQASSLVGATGNMVEFYAGLYELGACGIEWIGETAYEKATDAEKLDSANWNSSINDDVYGCMMYCPISDLDNADLAYAWMHFDDGITSFKGWGGATVLSEYQLQFQNDLAYAFAEYINGLELVDENGEALAFDVKKADGTIDLRAGSYYESVLAAMSDALNRFIAAEEWKTYDSTGYNIPDKYPFADCTDGEDYLKAAYGQYNEGDISEWKWLEKNEDGTYSITDMAGFINGTNLIRNKNVPGFDPFNESAESDAFGGDDNIYSYDEETNTITVEYTSNHHFSQRIADVIKANMVEYDYENEDYSTYEEWLYWLWMDNDGHAYVEEFGDEEYAAVINQETWWYNATSMMQDYEKAAANGTLSEMPTENGPTIATYWRSRNGTADQHTSFTIAYNIYLTVEQYLDTFGYEEGGYDYSLVWAMTHGWIEGESTGTFDGWVESICK